jgi:hypothetical protein
MVTSQPGATGRGIQRANISHVAAEIHAGVCRPATEAGPLADQMLVAGLSNEVRRARLTAGLGHLGHLSHTELPGVPEDLFRYLPDGSPQGCACRLQQHIWQHRAGLSC